ncbi:MAG: hypothetical protein JWM11_601 [Planctomycetaceae bacterium]|nr:hypothetical protein [Planctomycetaceae bacterium]
MRARSLIPWLLLGCCVMTGCQPAPKPIPMPKPVILGHVLDQNVFTSNEVVIQIRNDGADGIVNVRVYALRDQSKMARGESGIGKTFREAFTQDAEPPPVNRFDYKRVEYGDLDAQIKAGETKTVRIKVPSYNLTRILLDERLLTEAVGRIPSK